jgi:hypothetical protein
MTRASYRHHNTPYPPAPTANETSDTVPQADNSYLHIADQAPPSHPPSDTELQSDNSLHMTGEVVEVEESP